VHDLRLKLWNLYIRYLDVWARRPILVLGVCFIIFSCGNGIESLFGLCIQFTIVYIYSLFFIFLGMFWFLLMFLFWNYQRRQSFCSLNGINESDI
jgi:hypothetical protein